MNNETITQRNLEGVIVKRDDSGEVVCIVMNDLKLRMPVHYKVEKASFSDFEDWYK